MTPKIALRIARQITEARSKAVVIISTHEKLDSDHPRIVHGGALSIRQTTRLTNYVDLFVGCGAAVTVAATSEAAKPALPTIQILCRSKSVFASFRHDFAYFGKPTENFLEVTSEDPEHIGKVILAALAEGFAGAQREFDDPVPLTFEWYLQLISMMVVERGKYLDAVQSLLTTMARYGRHPELVQFARYYVLPFTDADLRCALPHRREQIEKLRQMVG
jgi:hypothetical protein